MLQSPTLGYLKEASSTSTSQTMLSSFHFRKSSSKKISILTIRS